MPRRSSGKKTQHGLLIPKGSEKYMRYDESGEEIWQIEKILDIRENSENGSKEYLIKWQGWPQQYCNWEPEENVLGLEDIETFYSVGLQKKLTKTPKITSTRKSGRKAVRKTQTRRKRQKYALSTFSNSQESDSQIDYQQKYFMHQNSLSKRLEKYQTIDAESQVYLRPQVVMEPENSQNQSENQSEQEGMVNKGVSLVNSNYQNHANGNIGMNDFQKLQGHTHDDAQYQDFHIPLDQTHNQHSNLLQNILAQSQQEENYDHNQQQTPSYQINASQYSNENSSCKDKIIPENGGGLGMGKTIARGKSYKDYFLESDSEYSDPPFLESEDQNHYTYQQPNQYTQDSNNLDSFCEVPQYEDDIYLKNRQDGFNLEREINACENNLSSSKRQQILTPKIEECFVYRSKTIDEKALRFRVVFYDEIGRGKMTEFMTYKEILDKQWHLILIEFYQAEMLAKIKRQLSEITNNIKIVS